MSREPGQTVIDAQMVDVNRFNSRRPNRKHAKISHREITERIALETEIGPQIFFSGVMQRDLPCNCQKNRAMKNRQKRHAHSKRRCNATPPAPLSLRLCLTIFGHCNDSISTLTKSNTAIGNSIRWYVVDLSQFKVKLKAEF